MQYKIHISKLTPYRVKDFVVIKMFIISSPKKNWYKILPELFK